MVRADRLKIRRGAVANKELVSGEVVGIVADCRGSRCSVTSAVSYIRRTTVSSQLELPVFLYSAGPCPC